MKQSLTQRLLIKLVDICKPQHLFSVSWCKVQEGLIACTKVLVISCDQQHTVSVEKLVSFTVKTIQGQFWLYRMLNASSRKMLCLIRSYFLRWWNCLTGHSSSKRCWLTSRGTWRNLFFETNSSMIWCVIPLACKIEVVKGQENVKVQKKKTNTTSLMI